MTITLQHHQQPSSTIEPRSRHQHQGAHQQSLAGIEPPPQQGLQHHQLLSPATPKLSSLQPRHHAISKPQPISIQTIDRLSSPARLSPRQHDHRISSIPEPLALSLEPLPEQHQHHQQSLAATSLPEQAQQRHKALVSNMQKEKQAGH